MLFNEGISSPAVIVIEDSVHYNPCLYNTIPIYIGQVADIVIAKAMRICISMITIIKQSVLLSLEHLKNRKKNMSSFL